MKVVVHVKQEVMINLVIVKLNVHINKRGSTRETRGDDQFGDSKIECTRE